jgi:type III secretory pathway component EscS
MLALVIAALPIIVALAVVGFLLGLFNGILGKIKL